MNWWHMTVCKILNDTILLQSQNCQIDVHAVKYSIIQNLPVATKTAFLCVSSLSFELHGAFSGDNENE